MRKRTLPVLGLVIFLASCKKNNPDAVKNLPNTSESFTPAQAYPGVKGEIREGIYKGITVAYKDIGTAAIIGGDVVVDKSEIEPPLIGGRTSGAIRTNTVAYWPLNTVPYIIDASLTNTARVFDAIAHWQANTNIRFVARTNEFNYVRFYYHAEGDGTFSSSVGKSAGITSIHLANWATVPNVIHEIGHAVGFYHEQCRTDRDGFVIINWNNMVNDDNVRYQYHRYIDDGKDGTDVGAGLDFNSIMLYRSSVADWSINPAIPLMTRLDGTVWGDNFALSNTDRVSAYRMYPHLTTGLGDHAEGGGAAITNLNGNASPDLIIMTNDAPSGPNFFKYQVGFDLNAQGNPATWSNIKVISGVGDFAEGANIAIGDIDRNGIPDILLMAYDAPSGANWFKYKIGFNLNANGDAASWSNMIQISGLGDSGEGAGVTLTDLDNNGILDIALMAYDAPSGANWFKYKIGYNLSTAGVATTWTTAPNVTGVGDIGEGAAIGFYDFDHNGVRDIILMAYDAPSGPNWFKYKIGLNVNTAGVPQSWLPFNQINGVGDLGEGVGLCISDINRDGQNDLVLVANDAPSGPNYFKYRIGFTLNNQGITADWR
jgi:hypothetical protein